MKKSTDPSFILSKQGSIDWKLLVFLLLFLNVKLVIKAVAIVLIYVLRPDFKFGFRLKNSRLPLFYILVTGIVLFDTMIYGLVAQINYTLVLTTSILFWVLCILAMHQVKISVEKNDPETLYRTITVFFILNALVSLLVYAGIVFETGAINPYRYQGNYQKYFIGTGDYIKGITFDTSTTNAVLSAFGVIFFLSRGKNILAIMCMTVLLLTGSNITNLLLCLSLMFIFFFQSNKNQKSIIVVCLAMLVVFLIKVSPQNNKYVATAYQKYINSQPETRELPEINIPITSRPDSTLTEEERKLKFAQLYSDSIGTMVAEKNEKRLFDNSAAISVTGFKEKPVIPGDSIHTPRFQHVNDTTAIEKELIAFKKKNPIVLTLSNAGPANPSLPGKLVAVEQTLNYYKKNPGKILTGAGAGNFSSKLAFRATSMKVAGGYPAKFAYISDDFRNNHLDLYLYYFTGKDDYHSIINSPNSTYDQLLGEYGLLGLVSFVIFYLVFFIKRVKKSSYAIPLFLFMLGAFGIEYWFEQLSVVIFFELLLFLNIKEINTGSQHAYSKT